MPFSILRTKLYFPVTRHNLVYRPRLVERLKAGLQLAALSLQGRADTSSFIENFAGTHHYIVDYLAGEVLIGQPKPAQKFLL